MDLAGNFHVKHTPTLLHPISKLYGSKQPSAAASWRSFCVLNIRYANKVRNVCENWFPFLFPFAVTPPLPFLCCIVF